MKNWQFYLLLAFTIIYTATLPAVFKITLREVSVEQITFFNYFIGFVLYLLWFISRKELHLVKESFSKIHYFIFIAFFGLFLNRFLYLHAFNFIQATEANILYYTYPLGIALLGFIVLKEKLKKTDIIGLLFGFIGAFIVITKLDFSLFNVNLVGDVLAISGGLAYASYLIFSKKFKFNPMVIVIYSDFFASLLAAIYILLFSSFSIPSSLGLAGLLYVGLADAILIWLFIVLLREANTFKIASSFYAIPFVATILNYLILNEIIYPSYILGLALLIVGILVQNKGKWKNAD